ncbi:MAG: S24/S26 family peptidase [Halioglobus sp.]|nr:S24/S26 family peptidase [Halioglobus sp.]
MQPSYDDGALLLSLRVPNQLLQAGHTVVVRVPDNQYIVKRIREVVDSGHIRLSSDNPAISSIYCRGITDKSDVVGLVLWPWR